MFRMLILVAAWLAGAAVAPSPARAQAMHVVELFASHNCDACPAAHQTLRMLADTQRDVLVLTWSVDYWDYLGEADPMALPDAKARQAAYVARFGLKGPYTPQTVYDGRTHCAGNRPLQVGARLRAVRKVPESGVEMQLAGGGVALAAPGPLEAEVWLVAFHAEGDHDTAMVNPVSGLTALGRWDGTPWRISLPDCPSGCAMLVQDAGQGAVLAALRLD